ncbi:MAG: hypothetical protein KJ063_11535 [Anaerolineae bacterium]|nr:hypothetical protein [Anaerolineae bacterium]
MQQRLPLPFRLAFFLLVGLALILLTIIIRNRMGPSSVPPALVIINQPAPTPVDVSSGELILRDDFSGTQGAWVLSQTGQAFYADGVMVLHDRHFTGYGWARPHLRFADFVLDVDTWWQGGALGGRYGVQFSYQDEANYYAFMISNDGLYSISRQVNGQSQLLAEEFTTAIRPAGQINRLRLETHGQMARFFINDVYLLDITQAQIERGDIVLVAQKATGADSFRVAFDNLTIHVHPNR